MGHRSALDNTLDRVQERASHALLTKWGSKALEDHAGKLAFIKDPTRYFRAVAFNMKLGMFNPIQMFLNAQTFHHMAGQLGVKRSGQAGSAMVAMNLLRMTDNPDMVAKAAANVPGWKAADFVESYTAMKRSGFHLVDREVPQLDDIFHSSAITTSSGRFLDSSRFFFTESERSLRMTAWNGAYLEWKAANPRKVLDEEGIREILNRADDLNVNMSSASNALWQQGLTALPTQFASYQIRLMEQMLPGLLGVSKRLPRKEAVKLFALYSAAYGVGGGGLGATFGGVVPAGEMFKQYLTSADIDYDDTAVEMVMDGIYSYGLEVLTGSDFALAERYGPGGQGQFRDFITGEKELWELVTGPAGGITVDLIDPAVKALMSIPDTMTNEGAYVITGSHILDIFRNISTVNNAYRSYLALNTGQWLSRNEVPIGEVTELEAIFGGIFGVQTEDINSTWYVDKINKNSAAWKSSAKKQALVYIRRGYRESDDNDRRAFFAKARTILMMHGFLPHEAAAVFREAITGETYSDTVHERFKRDQLRNR